MQDSSCPCIISLAFLRKRLRHRPGEPNRRHISWVIRYISKQQCLYRLILVRRWTYMLLKADLDWADTITWCHVQWFHAKITTFTLPPSIFLDRDDLHFDGWPIPYSTDSNNYNIQRWPPFQWLANPLEFIYVLLLLIKKKPLIVFPVIVFFFLLLFYYTIRLAPD